MRYLVPVAVALAAGFAAAQAADKPDVAKERPDFTKPMPDKTNLKPKGGFKKPEVNLPGGIKGTVGSFSRPANPSQPEYKGPDKKFDPHESGGGIILKKDF